MSAQTVPVTYSELSRLFDAARAHTGPAEAHGSLAGALCATLGYTASDWVAEVLPEGAVERGTDLALQGVYRQTLQALLGHDAAFALLVPDDEQTLESRTQALCQWCNGFLYGLAGNGAADPEQLPGDAGEIVRDFVQISRAGVDATDGDEANEAAYSELVEFVRVGVQLIFAELSARRRPAKPLSKAIH
jgi:uncharacterized protein YgfB (UPF0149 family)